MSSAQTLHSCLIWLMTLRFSIYAINLLFNLTVVYGYHTIQDRRGLWERLREIAGRQQGLWLVMGDFNTILYAEDRHFGAPVREAEVRDFREFLFDTTMTELQYTSRVYTWINNDVYSWIDRAIESMNLWPTWKIIVMKPFFSNHSPLKLTTEGRQGKGARPFRFFNCLAEHQDFLPLIKYYWDSIGTNVCMRHIRYKLKEVKQDMKKLNMTIYGGRYEARRHKKKSPGGTTTNGNSVVTRQFNRIREGVEITVREMESN
ncbi:uncharacterized protein [Nicotiana tomentosiformis]|uniref:uncharacterized protein n=1 Tax=Nicotiana tomentosiformis TaxID=4098 RepID=UPI00388C39DD